MGTVGLQYWEAFCGYSLQHWEALWVQSIYSIGRPCGYSRSIALGGLVGTVGIEHWEAFWVQSAYNIGRPCGYSYFTILGGLQFSSFDI